MGPELVVSFDQLLESDEIVVIYDGECPFCQGYVSLVRLRDAVGKVDLVDARKHPGVVAAARSRGFDLNRTMLVLHRKTIHVGSDAMTYLSMLSSKSGLLNRIVAFLFSNERTSRLFYPAFRLARGVVLRLLGRKPL
jgi:predicted DCC family thiol-disulfide oxidoreductase YuxK